MVASSPISARPVRSLDVAVLWDWEYDAEFLDLLRQRCTDASISFAAYPVARIPEFLRLIEDDRSSIRLLIDRASDVMPGVTVHLIRLKSLGARIVNDAEKMAWCRDKGTMHLELLAAGVRVPYGIILSTQDHPPSLEIMELAETKLGSPFVIKPANGGGGTGVILNARNKGDIIDYFKKTGAGKIVVQRKIIPHMFEQRRGWFRVFWVMGHSIPCWWDDLTHVYEPLASSDQARYDLDGLRAITDIIAGISGMDLFTTEIAVDEDGHLVAVDFVNEMPDLRPQSRHPDGVPNEVLDKIISHLIAPLKQH